MTSSLGQSDRPPPAFCDYEGTDYRADFWTGHGRDYEDRVERIAMTRLLPTKGQRLIDIGGGFGRLLPLYTGYREVVLMDPSKSQLEQARAAATSPVTYVAANVYSMPFLPGSFDTAVMVRVLHHLPDVPAAFAAIRQLLSCPGNLVLEFANQRNLKAILRWLLRRQTHNPFAYQPYEFAPLHFDFQPAYVTQHLQQAGFQIHSTLGVSQFRVPLLKRLIYASLLASIDGALQRPAGKIGLTPSIFLACHTSSPTQTHPDSQLFCCPACRSGDLHQEPQLLRCAQCGRRWSTAGGIYDFKQPIP